MARREPLLIARDVGELRARVAAHGGFRALAADVGCSFQHLARSASPTARVAVSLARRIEDALGADRGELFQVEVPDPAYLPREVSA